MAGTNGDDDMSSNARNTGSRFLQGEGDRIARGLLTRGLSLRGGREKLSMDSDRARLRGKVGSVGRGAMPTFRKVTFSSRKAALADKKKVNCCW